MRCEWLNISQPLWELKIAFVAVSAAAAAAVDALLAAAQMLLLTHHWTRQNGCDMEVSKSSRHNQYWRISNGKFSRTHFSSFTLNRRLVSQWVTQWRHLAGCLGSTRVLHAQKSFPTELIKMAVIWVLIMVSFCFLLVFYGENEADNELT